MDNCSDSDPSQRSNSIASLRKENGLLRRRCRVLEDELANHGVDVDIVLMKVDQESGYDSIDDTASTISKLSTLDISRMNQSVLRANHLSKARKQEMEHDSILGQVRHRRFTLIQEKIISKKRQSSILDPGHLEKLQEQNTGLKENGDDEEEEESKDDEDEKKEPKQSQRKSKRQSKFRDEMQHLEESKVPVFQLERGGIYVQTSIGPIQFGIPPETIKDVMKLGLEVPKYYVVPQDRFNLKLGLNMCEVEFPAYYNFFLRKASVNLVATPGVETLIRKVVDETLEGPKEEFLFVDQEYPTNGETTGRFSYAARPSHVKEINFFKEPREGREICTDSLVKFTHFLPFSKQQSRMTPEGIKVAQMAHNRIKRMRESSGTSSTVSLHEAVKERKNANNDKKEDQTSSKTSFDLSHEDILVSIIDTVEIIDTSGEYIILDKGVVVTSIQSFLTAWAPPPALPMTGNIPTKVIEPPDFGITVLGSSHGFDSGGSTSGFVLWMHKKGIMVDPPPFSTEKLQAAGIMPSMITGIILTHCHADHDAGAFQKILKEGRITLITTETIFSSFIRKYSLISGFAENFLLRLFEHRTVKIGEYVHWGGGTLRFFYSMHALPCIGFEAMVAGKTFVYSADTFYEPEGLRNLRDKGYLSKERCEALIDFPWDYDLVLHEAGIPPIHTPITALKALPESVQRNLYIIHITEKLADESGLRLAKAGVENTIVIETPRHEHATSAAILQLLRSTDIFKHFSISQASDLLQLCRHCTYDPGQYICKAGEVGKHFYVILTGFCSVKLGKNSGEGTDLHEAYRAESSDLEVVQATVEDATASLTSSDSFRSSSSGTPRVDEKFFENQTKVFGAGDYLGELALLTENNIRSADIVAVTKLSLIKLDKHAFKYLLDTTPGLQYRMERLSKIRCSLSWKAIGANSVLSRLRSTQRSQLQSVMQVQHVKAGSKLWTRGKVVEFSYLLASGNLEFAEMRDELETPFKTGSFFCNIASMMSKRAAAQSPSEEEKKKKKKVTTSRVTLVAKTDCDLYYIEAEDILEFLDQNPGVFINLIDSLVME